MFKKRFPLFWLIPYLIAEIVGPYFRNIFMTADKLDRKAAARDPLTTAGQLRYGTSFEV